MKDHQTPSAEQTTEWITALLIAKTYAERQKVRHEIIRWLRDVGHDKNEAKIFSERIMRKLKEIGRLYIEEHQ